MGDRRVTQIRAPARFEIDGAGPVIAVATFRLGMGPCGRDVTSLQCDRFAGSLRIVQHHADGSAAEFIYPLLHLTGRVEVTYA